MTVAMVSWTVSPEGGAGGVEVLAGTNDDHTASVKIGIAAGSRGNVAYDGAGTSYQIAATVTDSDGGIVEKTIEILFRHV